VGGRDRIAARELFDQYDGSRFYMSRDGVEADYERFGVPAEVERAWLEDLTERKLDQLGAPGNWAVVNFLLHHGDTRHLARLAATSPVGVAWERCAYLEGLLNYADRCAGTADPADVRAALRQVLDGARAIARRVRSARSLARVGEIEAAAERRLADLPDDRPREDPAPPPRGPR
jgi:hypothetical protein